MHGPSSIAPWASATCISRARSKSGGAHAFSWCSGVAPPGHAPVHRLWSLLHDSCTGIIDPHLELLDTLQSIGETASPGARTSSGCACWACSSPSAPSPSVVARASSTCTSRTHPSPSAAAPSTIARAPSTFASWRRSGLSGRGLPGLQGPYHPLPTRRPHVFRRRRRVLQGCFPWLRQPGPRTRARHDRTGRGGRPCQGPSWLPVLAGAGMTPCLVVPLLRCTL